MADASARDLVRAAATTAPAAPAVVAGRETLTYEQLARAPAPEGPTVTLAPTGTLDDVVRLWGAWQSGTLVIVHDPRRPPPTVPAGLPGDAHTLVPTSGSGGAPRAAILTAGNVAAAVRASAARLGTSRGDRWLLVLPLFHVGGLAILWRMAAAGGTVVLHERFDAARVAAALRRGEVTIASLVPTMLHRVLALGGPSYPGTRVLLGGAAAAPELVDRAFAAGLVPLPTYGMTETASQVATVDPRRAWEERRTVGRPLEGVTVTIAPATGEILVDGPTVFVGYAGASPRRGPHRTGDRGELDLAGRLVVTGRVDRMIVSGGENVVPERVEAVLSAHPAVEDAAVVGLPDPEWGEVVAALVVAPPAARDEIDAWCRDRLGRAGVPRRLRFATELPLLPNGKIDRASVRARLDEEARGDGG